MTTDNTIRKTMLLDFYGELLTEKQLEYFDLHYNEDLSLNEIAETDGITKQGVHDLITRAEKKLMKIEQKTGLMQKWSSTRAELEKAMQEGHKPHPAVAAYFQL